jgi:hypothetical protein
LNAEGAGVAAGPQLFYSFQSVITRVGCP